MIRASDWVVFLENGVSLEELPLSMNHRKYCLEWLRQYKKCPEKDRSCDFSNYPPKVHKRAELWTDYDASNDAYLVWCSK